MIIFLVIYILGFIAFLVHVFSINKIERTWSKIIELFLLYQLVFNVGITSFVAFIGLNFLDDVVENYTRWPSCPYAQELANVNLAYGVLGILSIWNRKSFWTAIVIGFSIWIFADALHHIYDAEVNQNYSYANLGALLYTDIFIPLLLCITLVLYLKTNKEPEKA